MGPRRCNVRKGGAMLGGLAPAFRAYKCKRCLFHGFGPSRQQVLTFRLSIFRNCRSSRPVRRICKLRRLFTCGPCPLQPL